MKQMSRDKPSAQSGTIIVTLSKANILTGQGEAINTRASIFNN